MERKTLKGVKAGISASVLPLRPGPDPTGSNLTGRGVNLKEGQDMTIKEAMAGPGCSVCGEPYDYEGTGLCGPCCTGEADTYGEGEYTGD